MRYASFGDYYRAVRQQSHAQALAQRGGGGGANVSASAIVLPSNQRDVIVGADEAMLDVTLDALDAHQKQFKQAFVALSVILANVYRNALRLQRKKSVSALRPQTDGAGIAAGNETPGDDKAATTTTENEVSSSGASQQARTAKLTREQCIPDAFLACRSNVAKAVVALYCMNGIRGATRRTILYHALAGQTESVAKTIALVGRVKQDAATTVKALSTVEIAPNEKVYPVLVQTLLELAELTRDKGPAKLAALVSEPVYLLAVQHLIKHSVFDSIYPYEPLIARYLHDCVAPINVAREQITIGNQFKLDPARTMGYLLEAIPKTAYRGGSAKSASGVGVANGAQAFDEERVYEVFVGQPNYIHNVMVTYTPHEGRNYRTITYNDCLYDVVGCSVERAENGQSSRDSVLYDNLRWSERLALLPYRAKIKLETMTGAELNAFRGNASLKVSWMENNHECSKIVTFKNGGGGAAVNRKEGASGGDDAGVVAFDVSE